MRLHANFYSGQPPKIQMLSMCRTQILQETSGGLPRPHLTADSFTGWDAHQHTAHPAQSLSSALTDQEELSSWKRKEDISKNEIPFSVANPFTSLFKTTISPPPPIKLTGFRRESLLWARNILSQHPKLSPIFICLPWEPRNGHRVAHLLTGSLVHTPVLLHNVSTQAWGSLHAAAQATRLSEIVRVGRDLHFIWTMLSFKIKLHGPFKDLRVLLLPFAVLVLFNNDDH